MATGSHNDGFRASYNNDENLLIIRGNQALAHAYSVNITDVYDHYRWRFTLQRMKSNAGSGLATDDKWQDRYLQPEMTTELDFWI